MVGVDGSLRQDRWEQDGQNRSKVVIVAANLQLLGGNPAGSGGVSGGAAGAGGSYGGSGSGGTDNQGGQSRPREAPPSQEGPGGGSDDGFADDIPF
jgi:single-strand DNA-binding protein